MLHSEQKEVIFIPHLGQSGWVVVEEGFMHGHISPLKESPHCQLPTIIKQPCRVYHWLCLTSLIRQMCATYIGQQSCTASITVPHFQTFRLLVSSVEFNEILPPLPFLFQMIVSWTVWHWETWKDNSQNILFWHVMQTRGFISSLYKYTGGVYQPKHHLCTNALLPTCFSEQ